MAKTPWRDDAGRFIEHDAWERYCVCGHTLGVHAAAKVDGQRPCFADNCDECMCSAFRAESKQSARKRQSP